MISHFFFLFPPPPPISHIFPIQFLQFSHFCLLFPDLPPPSGVISYLNALTALSVGKVKHFDNMTKMFFKHIIYCIIKQAQQRAVY